MDLGTLVGLVVELLRAAWRLAARKIGLSNEPRLTIGVDRRLHVDQAEASFLDWQHLVVENLGYPRARNPKTALDAQAFVRIDDREMRLRWVTHEGLQEKRNLLARVPEAIPFLIRQRKPWNEHDLSGGAVTRSGQGMVIARVPGKFGAYSVHNYPLVGGRYYMTDANLLTTGPSAGPYADVFWIKPGHYHAEVRVTYGKNGMAHQWFKVEVPDTDDTERLKWYRCDPPKPLKRVASESASASLTASSGAGASAGSAFGSPARREVRTVAR